MCLTEDNTQAHVSRLICVVLNDIPVNSSAWLLVSNTNAIMNVDIAGGGPAAVAAQVGTVGGAVGGGGCMKPFESLSQGFCRDAGV